METKEIYYWINQHQNSITQNQKLITNLETEIARLTKLKNEIESYGEYFSKVQFRRQQALWDAISSLQERNRYSKKILNGFETNMGELLAGSENALARRKIECAAKVVRAKIAQKRACICGYQEKIGDSLQESIGE